MKLDRVVRNSGVLIVTRIGTKVATALLLIYIARLIGDREFGIYSSFLAFTAFFSLVGELGLTVPMIRDVARNPGRAGACVGEVLATKVPLGIIAALLFLATGTFSGYTLGLTAVFAVSMFFEVQALSMTRAFEGVEMMKYIGIITIIERSVFAGIGILSLMAGWGLGGLGIAGASANVASLGSGWFLFRRHVNPVVLHFDRRVAWRRLREAVPFVVAGFFSVLYTRVDIFMLTALRSSEEVGWYSAAMRLVETQTFVPIAIVGAVFPVLARTYRTALAEFLIVHRRAFVTIAVIGALMAVATFFLADLIITILYTRQYAPAGPVLRNLSIMVGFAFVNFLLGNALIAAGKETLSTFTLGVGAVLSIAANWFVIPAYGAAGVGIVRAIGEIVCFVLQAGFLLRLTGIQSFVGPLRSPLPVPPVVSLDIPQKEH